MLKQRITKWQSSKKKSLSNGELNVDFENSTHFYFNNQNQKFLDFDKIIEN